MVDYDSFGPCWVKLDQDFSILQLSESFKDFNWQQGDLWSQTSIIQPTLSTTHPDLDQVYNRILILKFLDQKIKFRCTLHKMDQFILLLASPILNSLEKMKELSFSNYMNHPACQVMDLLILKDVIAKGQEKVRVLENKSIKMELEKQKQINQHQSKLASLGELAAGIGHEINNPLAIAIGNLELCRREFLKGDINLEHINKSIDKQNIALNRIKKIVDSLRVYTRSDNNIVEDFSLKDIVGEVFYLLEEIYLKEGVTLIFDSPRNDFTISGVPGEFQQVILNLIKNAKDSIKGRDRQEIILTVHRRPLDQLTISVADTGSGIPEEIRDKIFNPFFTSKPVGEGTGLGLGICHDIIERMGGKLYFDTIMDEGTTFSIDLPCRPENRANSSVLKQGPERKSRDLNNASEIPEGAELKGLRILLVEDEEFLLEATKIQIEDYGAEVFTAKCGATALDVFNEHEVDVILCDYMMPNLKGDQFYYKVEDRIRSKIPFFLITGGISNPSANVEKFLEAIDGVIEKPVSMPSLIEKLKEVKENLPG